ncbi:hypothetical protein Tco_0874070 [Tanacetum coccineum]|uniref:Retrotransposon protein, putative, Ty1-copia subclass n=1 Tax=Tanacetum coccineum TaxID=301880 RepID=A0ABQ5BM94_9ASTR
MKNVPYASVVGSIIYAVRCTRPDVAFAQNMTSRFKQNPSELHWTAVKNILKYLRNTKDMLLVYGRNPSTELRVEYYCAVDWKSSKQSTTAMSATESEYIARSKLPWKLFGLRSLSQGLCVKLGEIRILKVHTDNNLADPFTKALSNRRLTQHARSMGLRPASSFM